MMHTTNSEFVELPLLIIEGATDLELRHSDRSINVEHFASSVFSQFMIPSFNLLGCRPILFS